MKTRINCGLALILSVVVGTSPILTFAAGSNRSTLTLPKREKGKFVSKPAEPKRATRTVVQVQPDGQSATLLPDGRTLLIGGEGTNGPLATVLIRDPRTQEVSPFAGGLNQARAWHSATMLPDGKVLVLGGIGAGNRVISDAEIFDAETGRSELVGSATLTARAYHTATLLTDGQVLIVGGWSTGRALTGAELFDTRTRTALALPAGLSNARQKHKATLLADGSVLFEGGAGSASERSTGAELYNTAARSFSPTNFTSEQAGIAPYVAGSLPADGVTEVPVDVCIGVRFSKELRVETLNSETVKLTSLEGTVPARVVGAENGKLAFITPREPLLPGTSYTVSLTNASDGTTALIPATISFATAGERRNEPQPSADLDWVPNNENFRGDWNSKGGSSVAQDQPPLQAEPGVTALSGLVLTLLGKPLADVTISIDGHSTRTDSTGRFLLTSLSNGHRVMLIDGRTANQAGRVYGTFRVGVDIESGKTNVLSYKIWMPRLDMGHAVNITSPTTQEVVITNPLIPGLELRLPAGTVIRDIDGNMATQISITPVPTDRPPFPLPNGFRIPVFASIQPGGAQIIPPRARLIYPNYTNERPGARINFWNYDPEGKGWYIYGKGSVSPDGKQVIPDPGVVIYEFSGIMISGTGNPPDTAPRPGNCKKGGDPVDLSTGLFLYEKADLTLTDTMPVEIRRVYRPQDPTSRTFGIGTTFRYDMFLWSVNNYQEADLILPDGARIHLVRISPGTGFTDAVYEHTATPTAFYKARMFWNGTGWDLRLRDGTTYVFPDFAPLAAIRDRYGNQITITRTGGSNGNISRITSPNGRFVEFTYDTSNRVTKIKDNISRVVDYTYDASGRLWKATNLHFESETSPPLTEYTYDTSHRMLTIKDPRNNNYVVNEYDANGRVWRQTQADLTTFLFAYTLNGSGNVTQTEITDPRGHVRRLVFNNDGYTTAETHALGTPEEQTTTYERQPVTNLLLSMIDAFDHKTAFTYDSAGSVLTVTENADTPAAQTYTYTYESVFNQVTSVTDPLNHTLTFDYDANGNLSTLTDPLDHETTYTYTSAGQLASTKNALNHTTTFTYEAGILASVTDPLGRITSWFADAGGRKLTMTSPLGLTTSYQYDAMNRLVKITSPQGEQTSFAFDANSNLLSVTDPRTKVTSYSYDVMNRLQTRTDPLLKVESYEYDQAGNLKKYTDRRNKVTTFSYDALDRRTFVGYGTIAGPAYESTITYTYGTNSGGCGCGSGSRPTTITDSLAGTVTRTYDDFDRLISEVTPQGTVSYTYDAADRIQTVTIPGQGLVTYTHDDANRLTGITQGASTISIGYDDANRRTSLTLPNGVLVGYGYDNASQLTSINYGTAGGPLGNLTYTYDVGGRRSKMGGSFAQIALPDSFGSSTIDDANRLTQRGSSNFTYDDNGNLTSDGTKTYTWNARNELSAVSGPGLSSSFLYDSLGRRVRKTVNGVTTDYLWDGVDVVQEQQGGSATANMLIGGLDEIFTRTDGSGTQTLLLNAIRSTVGLVDGSGVVQTQYNYDSFGGTAAGGASSSNTFQYAGRENDATGLYYNRARYYAPSLQRFISEDPIEFAGGINQYAYVENNPISFNDPLGLAAKSPEYCRRLLEKINNLIKKIKEREGELDENPLNLPEACAGDKQKPSKSRRGHRKLINMDKAALAARQAEYLAFCSDLPPNGAPAPNESYFDLKYWEAVTGLTGAALIIYLIISEGSRLYPPRNLVPVP